MEREEAIEILQGAIKKPNTKDGYLGQAIDMAIKALKKEQEYAADATKMREEFIGLRDRYLKSIRENEEIANKRRSEVMMIEKSEQRSPKDITRINNFNATTLLTD